MRIISKLLIAYILSLKRLLKINRLFVFCLIMMAMIFVTSCKNIESIQSILGQDNNGNAYNLEIPIEEWQTMEFERFSNYENVIVSEHIQQIQIDNNKFSLIPIREFQYINSLGRYFSFYLVNSSEQKIAGILPPSASLYEKNIVGINNISVQDLNSDGLEDILIEFDYPIGMGKFAAANLSSYEIYFQTGGIREYFYYEEELSKSINETVMNETVLARSESESSYIPDIDFVIELIRKNSET